MPKPSFSKLILCKILFAVEKSNGEMLYATKGKTPMSDVIYGNKSRALHALLINSKIENYSRTSPEVSINYLARRVLNSTSNKVGGTLSIIINNKSIQLVSHYCYCHVTNSWYW